MKKHVNQTWKKKVSQARSAACISFRRILLGMTPTLCIYSCTGVAYSSRSIKLWSRKHTIKNEQIMYTKRQVHTFNREREREFGSSYNCTQTHWVYTLCLFSSPHVCGTTAYAWDQHSWRKGAGEKRERGEREMRGAEWTGRRGDIFSFSHHATNMFPRSTRGGEKAWVKWKQQRPQFFQERRGMGLSAMRMIPWLPKRVGVKRDEKLLVLFIYTSA